MIPTTEEYQSAKRVVAEYENRTVKKFYKDEFDAVSDELKPVYEIFINFLFGKNETGLPLDRVLKIEHQVTFEQFKTLYSTSLKTGKKISAMLLSMENDIKYTKGKKSLFLTLNNWLNQRFTK